MLQQHAYCIIIIRVARCAPGDRKSRSAATRGPSRVCPSLARILRHLRQISSVVYRATWAFVRAQLPSWVTVTPPWWVMGRVCAGARTRLRSRFGGCLADFRNWSLSSRTRAPKNYSPTGRPSRRYRSHVVRQSGSQSRRWRRSTELSWPPSTAL